MTRIRKAATIAALAVVGLTGLTIPPAQATEAMAPEVCQNTGCGGSDTYCFSNPGCYCIMKPPGVCDGEDKCREP